MIEFSKGDKELDEKNLIISTSSDKNDDIVKISEDTVISSDSIADSKSNPNNEDKDSFFNSCWRSMSESRSSSWRSNSSLCLTRLGPLLLFLLLGSILIYSLQLKKEEHLLISSSETQINLWESLIINEFTSAIRDLRFLNSEPLLSCAINKTCSLEHNDNIANMLKHMYYDFSSSNKKYDQIRYLNESGWETYRVNYNSSYTFIVPDDELQNKKGRYYFDDTFELNFSTDIFISPLDLNIEHGEIEMPLKPMIRMGSPHFEKEEKTGIVLLNYFGSKILNLLKEGKKFYNIFLVDRNGYFLLNTNRPELEWGWMYDDDRKENDFPTIYNSALWENIKKLNSSSPFTYQHVDDGYITAKIICPIPEKIIANDISLKCPNFDYYWFLISLIPQTYVSASSQAIPFSITASLGAAISFIAIFIVYFSRICLCCERDILFPSIRGAILSIIAASSYRLYNFYYSEY